jgi:hypothetical protein
MWSKLTSFRLYRNGTISVSLIPAKGYFTHGLLKMTNTWHESYRAAILETDWAKMQERLQTAEREIQERQRVLSLDHGGTLEERQAIADALSGMKVLRAEVAGWQNRQVSDDATTMSP